MAIEVEEVLLASAAILAGAFLANLAFRCYRVPDVLLLIGLGVLLGPVTGLADVGLFESVGPLVATIAILVILFDGGLEIRWVDLRGGAGRGLVLAFAVFTVTAGLVALGAYLWGLSLPVAILLGLVLGGSGVVIVIPLARALGVDQRAATAVTVEAAVADVLVIVGVYVTASAIATGQTDGADIAGRLVVALAVGLSAGIIAGLGWARVLQTSVLRGYEYVLTLAAVFMTHALVELLSGSGPIAVLVMGLVLGNSRRSRPFAQASAIVGRAPDAPLFGEVLTGTQQEVVFLVRAFVFVGLGATLDVAVFRTGGALWLGVALTLVVAVARMGTTPLVLRGSQWPAWDRAAVGVMFHRGVAAAALSQVPWQHYAVAGTHVLPQLAALVIIGSNILASILVAAMARPAARQALAS